MAKSNAVVLSNENEVIESAILTGGIEDILESLDVANYETKEEATESVELNELELEAAVSGVEIDALKASAYDAVDGDATVQSEADKPKTEKKKKEKVAAAPRVFFSKQSERIAHGLGEKTSEMMLLVVADAMLTGDDLKARNDEVLASVDKMAKKVGEKANILFKWMHKGGELNEVMARAFKVLVRDGELTSGEKGNLQLDLLAKPYSLGTARSQANQVFMLFPALMITVKENGKMVPNPDSLIMAKARAQLAI